MLICENSFKQHPLQHSGYYFHPIFGRYDEKDFLHLIALSGGVWRHHFVAHHHYEASESAFRGPVKLAHWAFGLFSLQNSKTRQNSLKMHLFDPLWLPIYFIPILSWVTSVFTSQFWPEENGMMQGFWVTTGEHSMMQFSWLIFQSHWKKPKLRSFLTHQS